MIGKLPACGWENATDTSDDDIPSGYRTWFEYYDAICKEAGKSCREYCAIVECESDNKIDLVGGHMKCSVEKSRTFIVPICRHCNGEKENLGVVDLKPGTFVVDSESGELYEIVSRADYLVESLGIGK